MSATPKSNYMQCNKISLNISVFLKYFSYGVIPNIINNTIDDLLITHLVFTNGNFSRLQILFSFLVLVIVRLNLYWDFANVEGDFAWNLGVARAEIYFSLVAVDL